ncbi:MAG: anthranilate synthase component I [Actinomycetota bacterium]|nr:anthranilate synthase component I [Actinomycetota bacterium]
MYYPNFEEFKRVSKDHNLIPVYRDLIADTETPVSAFRKIEAGSDYAFLLESAEKGERFGRYSFLGSDPYLRVWAKGKSVWVEDASGKKELKLKNPLSAIEEIISTYNPAKIEGLPPFFGGAVGYIAYDMVENFEDIKISSKDDLGLNDMVFFFTDTILIFDHLAHRIKVVANAHINGDAKAAYEDAGLKIDTLVKKIDGSYPRGGLKPKIAGGSKVTSNIERDDFLAMVERAKEYIRAGDLLQVVLSQRFSTKFDGDPFDIYRALRIINPSPYMYYLKLGASKIIGSSPESLVKVTGQSVSTCPIAGTKPRGRDAAEDLELETNLLGDPKERAEHLMLVDLGRNDIGRVAKAGSVEVEDFMTVERYSHVMHIVTTVTGQLKEGKSAFDAIASVFPAGTVSGAPKIRAMEVIDELEKVRRGTYAGAIGYFSYLGDLDSAITIRTILIHEEKAYVQVGAGIVYDSKAESEYEETKNKAKGMLKAVSMAKEGLL